MCIFFFFSSRRRHTRLTCDWSSDVCLRSLRSRRRAVGEPSTKQVKTVASQAKRIISSHSYNKANQLQIAVMESLHTSSAINSNDLSIYPFTVLAGQK